VDRPDHKIVVDAHDDPKVGGVTATSRARRPAASRAGWASRKTSPRRRSNAGRSGRSRFRKPLPAQEEVFNERISLIFKKLRIVRMVDKPRNTLVYSRTPIV
jgi:CreA protein